MTPQEILRQTRQLIEEHAAGDPDNWWYANRFVFARLQLDERKTKTSIKRELFDANKPCHYCGKPFETKYNVHLHRLDQTKGYNKDNCALMHAECHQQCHSESKIKEIAVIEEKEAILVKRSKKHDELSFFYWWDISPSCADSLDKFDMVEFVKNDSGERCIVPPADLKGFLTEDRQTSRSKGPWGVKVLKDHKDELAFEPGTGKTGKYLFLPVIWINEQED
ncbi:MAG: HNH endonuclease [Phycisphaerae bacterium]|nr:HNH endonuclease [Phycisphaerae bacterium]